MVQKKSTGEGPSSPFLSRPTANLRAYSCIWGLRKQEGQSASYCSQWERWRRLTASESPLIADSLWSDRIVLIVQLKKESINSYWNNNIVHFYMSSMVFALCKSILSIMNFSVLCILPKKTIITLICCASGSARRIEPKTSDMKVCRGRVPYSGFMEGVAAVVKPALRKTHQGTYWAWP